MHAVLPHGVRAWAPQSMEFWCKPSTHRLRSACLISQPACTKSLFMSEEDIAPGGPQEEIS